MARAAWSCAAFKPKGVQCRRGATFSTGGSFRQGNGSRKLIVYSDADCPFCHRLENEMKNLDNVTIYTFLFPIDGLHPDAANKSRKIWCAPDKVKAWDAFFASGNEAIRQRAFHPLPRRSSPWHQLSTTSKILGLWNSSQFASVCVRLHL